jgi:hypothetical protein
MNDLIIVSIHITKCAGTTLAGILQSVYGDRFLHLHGTNIVKEVVEDNCKNVDCIHGHFSYGIKPNRNIRYITFLRNPLERLLSLYWNIQNEPKHPQYSFTMRLTFREWLESRRFSCLDNDIVRFLSGNRYLNFSHPDRFVCQEDLELARTNLSKFYFVGFVERFDKDIIALSEYLDWSSFPMFQNELVSTDRPALAELSKSTIEYMEKKQRFDIELYEWAKEHL